MDQESSKGQFHEDNVIYRYKYMPFSEGSLKTLTEGTIKFTCPLDFNDPFDCAPTYNTSTIGKFIQPKISHLKPAERIIQKQQIERRTTARLEDGTFLREALINVGVVSLSKNPKNILMWSHYADFHRGFVLELRIPIKGSLAQFRRLNQLLTPLPVIYSDNRPYIDLANDSKSVIVNKSLLTKSSCWSYEEEERVINMDHGPGILPYARNEIASSIIAGPRMNKENYSILETITSEISKSSTIGIQLFKSEINAHKYEIDIPSHPRCP